MKLEKIIEKEIEENGFGNFLFTVIEVLEKQTEKLDSEGKSGEAREVERDIAYLQNMSQNR